MRIYYMLMFVFFVLLSCKRELSDKMEVGNGLKTIEEKSPNILLQAYSGTILENKARYSNLNLLDGRTDSWCEGSSVLEEERNISFSVFDSKSKIKAKNIYLINGFGNPEYWNQNNRVKSIRITLINGFDKVFDKKMVLKDQYDNIIHIPEVFFDNFGIQILSVYPGTKYDDTCIAEVSLYPIKHSDLIGSKFKPEAQFRDRDFWGREFILKFNRNSAHGFNLGKGGKIVGDGYSGSYSYYLNRSHWKLRNNHVYIELYQSWQNPMEPDTPAENYRYNFSIPAGTVINDVDGSMEVDAKIFQKTRL